MKIIPVILSPGHFSNSKRWRELFVEVNWGLLDTSATTRNLTEEILRDIVKAIRNHDTRRCPVICVYHFQGGVGKTTICGHMAAQLYHAGRPPLSVLLIDCDAQANLSSLFLTQKMLRQRASTSQNLVGMLEPNRLRAELDKFKLFDVADGRIDDSAIHKVQTALNIDDKTDKSFSIVPNSISATKYGAIGAEQRVVSQFEILDADLALKRSPAAKDI